MYRFNIVTYYSYFVYISSHGARCRRSSYSLHNVKFHEQLPITNYQLPTRFY
ncbi:MAG: hypothetical protein HC849_28485 [Oscillatoriales cyanobacterium RU_3_3]|nr:hypothetical protein [Microcoleus sp. SU_5_6]NJL66657.1 hypothetical protein [Microcoleus sp. SM1_3_4]NJM63223.1 hypothetical protein [Oscillatoriales cyanobacterium RU_3_3]NJR23112.1 hypothetical protein [Richelia sp. CSU_2_1]